MVTTNVIIKRDQVDTMSNSGKIGTRSLSAGETKTQIARLFKKKKKKKRKFLSRILYNLTRDRRDIVMTEIQSSSFLVPTVPWTISKGGRRSYPESIITSIIIKNQSIPVCVLELIKSHLKRKFLQFQFSLFSADVVATRDST